MASKEELEAMGIKQANNQNRYNNTKNSNENNQIATVLKAFSIITMIISVVTFLILMEENFYTGLIVGVSGIVGGIFILGFAEIIQKLQNIEDNTRKWDFKI